MKVVKWITGASRGRGKSLIPSTIITLAIVAMLILSGPAQAVAVSISGQNIYTKDKDIEFQVKIDLNENDKFVPLTNISLDLKGNVSQRAVFDLNGKRISSNSKCNIEMEPVSVPKSNDFGYGRGYGYDKTGTGYGYDFGYGYGYGYGYGGGGGKISYIYNVSIENDCLSAGKYTVVATLNTDQNIAFHSSPFTFELTAGKKLNADVDIKPETLNLARKGTMTAFITSDEFDVKDINGSTVTITCDGCNSVHAVKWNKAGKKFIAEFKTQDLKNVDTGEVTFIVTGKLKNGTVTEFEGSDTIRVIEKGKKGHDDDDDEFESDDDHVKEHDDDEGAEDHDDDDHVKEHDDDDHVKEHKPQKNKDDDNKNSNNGGKVKNVVVINDNTGTVVVNINDQGSETRVEGGNSKEVNHGNNKDD